MKESKYINMWICDDEIHDMKGRKYFSVFSFFWLSVAGVDNKKQRGNTRNIKSLIIAGAPPEFQAGKD